MAFLTAEWKDLLMFQFPVPWEKCLPYIPPSCELDLWEGVSYASLVFFQFQNFSEINLRLYVKRKINGEVRRGVVFVKELVPSPLICDLAQLFYDEPYFPSRISYKKSTFQKEVKPGREIEITRTSYRFRGKGRVFSLKAQTSGEFTPLIPDSHPQFIAEHYWGYKKRSPKDMTEYQVTHPPWKVKFLDEFKLKCDFGLIYGKKWSFLNDLEPTSSFCAKGSPIEVHWPQLITFSHQKI